MSCPNPELLAAMAEGRLDPTDRDAVLDHAAACDDCRQTLLILGARPALRLRSVPRSWIPWAGAAAAVLVASIAGLFVLSGPPREDRAGAWTPRPKVEPPEPPRRAPEPPKPEPLKGEIPPPKPAQPPALPPVEPLPAPALPVKPAPQPPDEPAPSKPAPTPEPPKPATVPVLALLNRVEGEVYVLRGPERTTARAGRELLHGEGLECKGARSGAILSYPDKTRLELEGETRVRELLDREGSKGRRLFVEKGAVKAEVSRQPAGQAMIFETPHGEAKVLGTILRVHVDKAMRLEVEEGKVELKNPAGKTVLVEGGHVAVSGTGVAFASKRLPREEALYAYDFEDGKKPDSVSRAAVERGPGNRLCLAVEAEAGGSSRLFIGEDPDGLFTATGEEVLSFDYWVDSQAGSVNFHFWNSTQKLKHEYEVPKLVFQKWTRVTVRVADLGEPGARAKEGDWIGNLVIQGTGGPPRRFYVDNLTVTRPRTLKPRPTETK